VDAAPDPGLVIRRGAIAVVQRDSAIAAGGEVPVTKGYVRALCVAGIVLGSIALGCAKAQHEGAKLTTTTTTTAPPEDFVAEPSDFIRLQDMTPVRGFFISNPAGHLQQALAVARPATARD